MSTEDEKEYLKAVLEGREKPGNVVWRKIWKEKDFVRVRKALREVGGMNQSDVAFDRDKMWRVVEKHRGEGNNRRRVVTTWRWVAAVAVPLLVGGSLWFSWRENKEMPDTRVALIEAGGPQAVLIMAKGERINLASIQVDTLTTQGGVRVCLDSSRCITYEGKEGQPKEVEYNTIVVPRKGEYQLILADGSKVYLNSESEIRFPTFFSEGERKVYLQGEAFFEVSPDKERPFIVNAGEINVKVLGTRFNVNAYTSEEAIRTTLVSGKVQVSDKKDSMSAIISPGQQVVWEGGKLLTREVDASAVTAWINGKFYFEEGATLEQITRQLQRWYDVDFFFTSERVKKIVFAGVIRKEYTANEIFSIIEKTTRVKFNVNGRTVMVSELK